jgi:hypothetical protein
MGDYLRDMLMILRKYYTTNMTSILLFQQKRTYSMQAQEVHLRA